MREQKFDATIHLTNSFRTALLAWSSGAKQRVGYVRNGRGPLLTHKLYHPRRGFHRLAMSTIDEYLSLAYVMGCELESPRLELATLPADEAAADARLEKTPAAQRRPGGRAQLGRSLWRGEVMAQRTFRQAGTADRDRAGNVGAGSVRTGRTGSWPARSSSWPIIRG